MICLYQKSKICPQGCTLFAGRSIPMPFLLHDAARIPWLMAPFSSFKDSSVTSFIFFHMFQSLHLSDSNSTNSTGFIALC